MLDASGVDFSKILTRYDVKIEVTDSPEGMAMRMLPKDEVLRAVAEQVLYRRVDTVESVVAEAIKIRDPLEVINNGLVTGMDIASKLYTDRIFHLPDIMRSSKAMRIGIVYAEQFVPGGSGSKATVVMHAAEGDPHDIGKHIAVVMMRSSGYNVIDMGRNVPITEAVAKVLEVKPLFVSGTALMTTTMTAFPAEAKIIKANGLDIPFMCSGGAVNRDFANSFDLGIYSRKAPQTPIIASKLLEGYDWRRIREEWDEIVRE